MNQSDSKNHLVKLTSQCAFHKTEIICAVVLLVAAFLIKHDGLLTSTGVTDLSWMWLLFLPAMIIPARRRNERLCVCSPCDPVGECDPTYDE